MPLVGRNETADKCGLAGDVSRAHSDKPYLPQPLLAECAILAVLQFGQEEAHSALQLRIPCHSEPILSFRASAKDLNGRGGKILHFVQDDNGLCGGLRTHHRSG